MSTLPLLIQPENLTDSLSYGNVLIVDLSRRETYARLHAPGAVHIDYARIVTGRKPVMGLVPDDTTLESVFSAIGISICLLLTLVFLPCMLALLKVLPGREREKLYETSIYNRMLIWMGRTGIRHAHDIYILSCIIFSASLAIRSAPIVTQFAVMKSCTRQVLMSGMFSKVRRRSPSV